MNSGRFDLSDYALATLLSREGLRESVFAGLLSPQHILAGHPFERAARLEIRLQKAQLRRQVYLD
jgi:hypothetical protein